MMHEVTIRRVLAGDLEPASELGARLARQHHEADPDRFSLPERVQEGVARDFPPTRPSGAEGELTRKQKPAALAGGPPRPTMQQACRAPRLRLVERAPVLLDAYRALRKRRTRRERRNGESPDRSTHGTV